MMNVPIRQLERWHDPQRKNCRKYPYQARPEAQDAVGVFHVQRAQTVQEDED